MTHFAFFNNQGRVILAGLDATVNTIPEGAVALTEEQFNRRFDLLLTEGGAIAIQPQAPLKSDVDIRVIAEARAQRARMFATLDIMHQDALTLALSSDAGIASAAKAEAEAILNFKIGLRNITTTDLSSATDYASAALLIANAYKALLGPVPANLKAKFKQVLAA